MAPTPVLGDQNQPQPSPEPAKDGKWSTSVIVCLALFLVFSVAGAITFIAFRFHKRAERKKLPAENRPVSYRPFRRTSDKSSLLANAAPAPEDDKSSMFSRTRGSSVSLYVDHEGHDRRESMETVSLIPLHITPAEEVYDPMDRASAGSGVSGGSKVSTSTGGSLGLSNIPIPEHDGDLGTRVATRPRSTSAASQRYYETKPTQPASQIPAIVHTPSD